MAILTIAALTGTARDASAQQVAGVNDHLLRPDMYPWRYLKLEYAAILGAKVVRVDLDWSALEPNTQGKYDPTYLSEIDSVVSMAQSFGIKPLFTVLWTPCWASSAPASLKSTCASSVKSYPPTKVSYYANTLKFLASRYGSQVAGWEIWNEPNLSGFWTASDPAASYTALVKAAYPAVKAVSSAPVMAGSVSLSNTDFVGRLYQDGINGRFDALSIHPYSFNASPLDAGSYPYYTSGSFVNGVPAVRNVMLRYGDTRPMWLTEFGWNTSTSGVSPDTQATYVGQAYAQMRLWPYVQGGVYYELQDEGTDPSNNELNFGLLNYDGSRKPAADAFQQAAASL